MVFVRIKADIVNGYYSKLLNTFQHPVRAALTTTI